MSRYGFIRDKRFVFSMPGTTENVDSSWELKISSGNVLPFNFANCRFSALGILSEGGGDGLSSRTAILKSFSEAWERWWFQYESQREKAITSSSGYAASATIDDAKIRARDELLERSLVLQAWAEKKYWHPYQPTGLLVRSMIRFLRTRGLKVRYFLIPSVFDFNALTIIGETEQGGIVFDSASGASSQVELKLLLSIVRAWEYRDTEMSADWSLPKYGSPRDHALFYSLPKNRAAFDFILNGDPNSSGAVALKDVDQINVQSIYVGEKLPCVARASHPTWPILCWGQDSITDSNLYPHPIA